MGTEGMGLQNNKKIKAMATAGLCLVTLIWGSTFVILKNSLDLISPSYVMAYRFTIAGVGLVVIFWKKTISMTRRDLKYGSILGALLFISYYFQTYGLKYTTASKNAFITTLYVIIVPFLHWLFSKKRPSKNSMIAAVIAVIGLAFVSLKGDKGVNLGDLLTLAGGFCFALHMVYIDRYTQFCDPVKLTVVQMVSTACLSCLSAVLFEGPFQPGVLANPSILFAFLYLGIIASMVCFLLQTVGQTFLSANTASILLSFESVFGLVFSVIFLKESVTGKMLFGCALMFSAAILSEYTPSSKKKEKRIESGDAADGEKREA